MRFFMVFILLAQVHFSSLAQAQEAGRKFKRNTAIILFSSLGGAVLGLSTLSFYGKPEEHTTNITNGALLGALVGAGYIAFRDEPSPRRWDEMQSKRGFGSSPTPPAITATISF